VFIRFFALFDGIPSSVGHDWDIAWDRAQEVRASRRLRKSATNAYVTAPQECGCADLETSIETSLLNAWKRSALIRPMARKKGSKLSASLGGLDDFGVLLRGDLRVETSSRSAGKRDPAAEHVWQKDVAHFAMSGSFCFKSCRNSYTLRSSVFLAG